MSKLKSTDATIGKLHVERPMLDVETSNYNVEWVRMEVEMFYEGQNLRSTRKYKMLNFGGDRTP